MKKLLLLFSLLLGVFACSDDYESPTTAGLVKSFICDDLCRYGFFYDSQQRIESIVYINQTSSSVITSTTITYSYGENTINIGRKDNDGYEDTYTNYVVTLNSDGNITQLALSDGTILGSYEYQDNVLSSAKGYAVTWDGAGSVSSLSSGGNSESYVYTSIKNNTNIDLNMYICDEDMWSGAFDNLVVGINKQIGGLSSDYIVDMSGDDCTYAYSNNSDGKLLKLSWNTGSEVIDIEVDYYE